MWTDNQRPLLAELALLEEYQSGALQSRSRGSSPACAWLPSTVAAGPGRAMYSYTSARAACPGPGAVLIMARRWRTGHIVVSPHRPPSCPLLASRSTMGRIAVSVWTMCCSESVTCCSSLLSVRWLAKRMAEHDKVGACIFERTGGASAVFHGRWDTFVSMAVRVQGAAGHAGRPWPALAAVLGGPDSLVPGPELRAIRSSPRIELGRAAGGPGFHGCSVVG